MCIYVIGERQNAFNMLAGFVCLFDLDRKELNICQDCSLIAV